MLLRKCGGFVVLRPFGEFVGVMLGFWGLDMVHTLWRTTVDACVNVVHIDLNGGSLVRMCQHSHWGVRLCWNQSFVLYDLCWTVCYVWSIADSQPDANVLVMCSPSLVWGWNGWCGCVRVCDGIRRGAGQLRK